MTLSDAPFVKIIFDQLEEIRKDIKGIREEQKKTCVEIEKQKLLLVSHLKCKDKKSKSRREKALILIAIVSASVAILSYASSIFFS